MAKKKEGKMERNGETQTKQNHMLHIQSIDKCQVTSLILFLTLASHYAQRRNIIDWIR